jgi:hypothetical protein
MIISESLLTTFEEINIFKAAWAILKIDSHIKPNHQKPSKA